jgi:hypothetical protein
MVDAADLKSVDLISRESSSLSTPIYLEHPTTVLVTLLVQGFCEQHKRQNRTSERQIKS